MTKPKDRAFFLIERFSPILPFYSVIDNVNKSKQCALIAVYEIIQELDKDSINYKILLDYWNEVNKEINKL